MKIRFPNPKYFILIIVPLLVVFSMQRTSYGANLNVGEPQTVRMIYFLPNDLPFRADVVQKMQGEILKVQTFYAEQMQAHGYGNKTFQVETDAKGEPVVHRVDGKHPFSHYDNTRGTAVSDELGQAFDLDANIYFSVLGADALRYNGLPVGGVGDRRSKNGGNAIVPNVFGWETVAHELGHVFGLRHDWRDGSYIMSYGPGPRSRLSACAAEFLAGHPYFNHDIPLKDGPPPTVELISSPGYPTGSTSVSVRLKVSDSDGIHQVLLFAQGELRGLKLCKGLNGERDAIVAFDYDGIISPATAPNRIGTSLSSPLVHLIEVEAVDVNGDVGSVSFELFDVSTRDDHVATLEGHRNLVASVAFSPDGTTLASGSWDRTFKLWDVRTQQNIATFEGYGSDVAAVAFSTDGTLAVGSNKLELWDVRTQQNIATFKGHGSAVIAIAFSTNGILASGGGDGDRTLKLWDAATLANIATFKGHGSAVSAQAFSPDGTTLAFGGVFSWENIELLDVETLTSIDTFEGHGANVLSIAYSPDGTLLASGSYDGTVKLWDVATGRNIVTFKPAGEGPAVAFSPDGTIVAAGTSSGVVELWAVPSRALESNEVTVASYADVNGDGAVNILDLVMISTNFGKKGQNPADANGDGIVNILDLVKVAGEMGGGAAAPAAHL